MSFLPEIQRLRRGLRVRWRRDPVPIFALVFSILAFGVSARSCHVSEEGLKQSRLQFKQERSLILTAKFNDKESKLLQIKVSPLESSFRFLYGTAYFPPSIYKDDVPINGDGEFLHMGSVGSALTQTVEKKVPKEKGFAKFSSGHLPLIIKSLYATKGESYTDISLYFIGMDILVLDDPLKAANITLTGLTFVERMPADTFPNLKNLDEMIESSDGVYLRPKTP
jgi:hypothetical protein